MKPLHARGTRLVLWVLFASIGAVLLWRYLGNPVPAVLVVVLALLMGALGLHVFVHNMKDAQTAWKKALSPGQVEQNEGEREAQASDSRHP